MSGLLILVVGPSGVGKDSLLEGAKSLLEGDVRFHFLRRDITRAASAGGEAHNAVSIAQFTDTLNRGGYGLNWGAHDLQYGLPNTELAALSVGKTVIANGSRSVLDIARSRFDRLAIISVTASENLLRQRLLAREREDADDIERRIRRARAFQVEGDDVFVLENDASLEQGIASFVELLAVLHSRSKR